MIVLRTPKGWTGPEGGRRPARRGHVQVAPGAARQPGREPGAPARARALAALLPARGAVRRGRPLRDELRALRPEGERRMSANPHANGGQPAARPRAARLPRATRSPSSSPAPRRPRRPGPGRLAARRHARESIRRQLPRVRPRRDGVEPARRPVRGDRPGLDGRPPRQRRPPVPRRPRDGDPERAPLPGLARGLPADRPPRALQLLRGVHPHRRLDVQPARQVAEGHPRHPVAQADRVAQLPALVARLAPGPQRLLASGPRLHRPRR